MGDKRISILIGLIGLIGPTKVVPLLQSGRQLVEEQVFPQSKKPY
jgi:hypothetical protein